MASVRLCLRLRPVCSCPTLPFPLPLSQLRLAPESLHTLDVAPGAFVVVRTASSSASAAGVLLWVTEDPHVTSEEGVCQEWVVATLATEDVAICRVLTHGTSSASTIGVHIIPTRTSLCEESVLATETCAARALRRQTCGSPVWKGAILAFLYRGRPCVGEVVELRKTEVEVEDERPRSGVELIEYDTNVVFEVAGPSKWDPSAVVLPGLEDLVERLAKLIQEMLEDIPPPLFALVGSGRGILVHGPSGVGKTALVQALPWVVRASFHFVSGTTLSSPRGSTELDRVWNKVNRHDGASVVVIDDLDSVAHKGDVLGSRGMDRAVISRLCEILDAAASHGRESAAKICIIGIGEGVENLVPALRRAGRFDRDFGMDAPNAVHRTRILQGLFKGLEGKQGRDLRRDDMAKIARRTPGFLPRDLVVLKHTAVLRALGRTHTTRRGEKEERTSTSFPCSTCQRFHSSYDLCWEDVEAALSLIRPSSLRDDEGYINGTPLAVVGYSTLKRQLRQIALSSLHFDASVTYGVTPPSGILLFGPPGCGKTAFVGWLAQETGVHFISVKGPEVFSKYLGETEARIRQLFRRAAQLAPSMLFFDEIEALGGARAFGEDVDSVGDVYRRTLSQLLNEMDGITERREVLVIGCTNRPDLLDAALIRPGRLERLVHVPLPDLEDRHAILTHYTHSMPLANDVDLLTLASQTTSLTGAELLALCRDAGLCALRQDLSANAVKAIHFSQGLERMRDRAPISSTGRLICERFAQQHGGIQ